MRTYFFFLSPQVKTAGFEATGMMPSCKLSLLFFPFLALILLRLLQEKIKSKAAFLTPIGPVDKPLEPDVPCSFPGLTFLWL